MRRTAAFAMLLLVAFLGASCRGDNAGTPATSASEPQATEPPGPAGEPSTSAGPGSAPPTETVDVSLRLDWLWGAEHAPYFVALDQGYYEEAGLNVDIREGEGSTLAARLVGTGDDTFGVVSAGTVLASVSQGIPLKTVATLIQ